METITIANPRHEVQYIMEEEIMFYGNINARKQIEEYLSYQNNCNLTLYGPKGVGKHLLAHKIAQNLLKCAPEKLFMHPDFMEITPINGVISVEQIKVLQSRACYIPSVASTKLFIVDDANTMTHAAQNKLLKLLEDKNDTNMFIFIAHQPLLETVLSRTITIKFKKISDGEMKNLLFSKGETDFNTYIPLCNGSISPYYLYRDSEFAEIMKKILSYFSSMKEKNEILYLLHLMKEKDKDNIYEQYQQHLEPLFNLLERLFYELFLYKNNLIKDGIINYEKMDKFYSKNQVILIFGKIREHSSKYIQKNYSKNNFFELITVLL